jgi:hypothetical protein
MQTPIYTYTHDNFIYIYIYIYIYISTYECIAHPHTYTHHSVTHTHTQKGLASGSAGFPTDYDFCLMGSRGPPPAAAPIPTLNKTAPAKTPAPAAAPAKTPAPTTATAPSKTPSPAPAAAKRRHAADAKRSNVVVLKGSGKRASTHNTDAGHMHSLMNGVSDSKQPVDSGTRTGATPGSRPYIRSNDATTGAKASGYASHWPGTHVTPASRPYIDQPGMLYAGPEDNGRGGCMAGRAPTGLVWISHCVHACDVTDVCEDTPRMHEALAATCMSCVGGHVYVVIFVRYVVIFVRYVVMRSRACGDLHQVVWSNGFVLRPRHPPRSACHVRMCAHRDDAEWIMLSFGRPKHAGHAGAAWQARLDEEGSKATHAHT